MDNKFIIVIGSYNNELWIENNIGSIIMQDYRNYKGKEFAIGFNPGYIINLLKTTDQDNIGFELVDPDKPGVVRVGSEYVYGRNSDTFYMVGIVGIIVRGRPIIFRAERL